jgi:uncharacterized flavoprotein (TIGR03862 family)
MSERGRVVVVGAGPAGLAAAEVIATAGHHVTVIERMPSFGRKLLMAGRGGLNLTHSEAGDRFLARYGAAEAFLTPAIAAFTPGDLRDWARGLGEETFVGTSGRVFPCSFKASPLLRAWSRRLAELGVESRLKTTWTGFAPEGVTVAGPAGAETIAAEAVVLALGGASWPRLGSDGRWTSILERIGVEVVPLRPTNCGFTVAWSVIFRSRFEGEPLKRIAIRVGDRVSIGEAMITADGLEGGAIYGLSAPLREAIAANGPTEILLDLKTSQSAEEIAAALGRGRKGDSLSNLLRKAVGLPPVAIGLLREGAGKVLPTDHTALARLIKAVPIRVTAARPLERAISSAGGVALGEVGPDYQLKRRPGVFVCGEMLDWEAPTGGYLLQACFATGRAAGRGAVRFLGSRP